jgi:hypothetical protein
LSDRKLKSLPPEPRRHQDSAIAQVLEAPHKGALHIGRIGFTERFDSGQLLRVRQEGSSTYRGDQDCTTRSPRRAGHGQVQPEKRNDERTIDGQRTGTARPLPLWRLPSGRIRRPSIQYSRVVLPPGPNSWSLNIPADCSVPARPAAFCWRHRIGLRVWHVCYIPPGKLRI